MLKFAQAVDSEKSSQNEFHVRLRELFIEEAQARRETRELHVKLSLLKSLGFPTMAMRQEIIPEAHQRTFEWIFRDPVAHHKPWSNFYQWLNCGSGIYWINGKAGSGKSTLMKFVRNHERTESELQMWAQNGILITPAFFFWKSGDLDQRSYEGLLRSLLYNVLEGNMDLFPLIFPDDWDQWYKLASNNIPLTFNVWTLAKLKRAFQLLLNQASDQLRFCFFIDGLDEYDGDHDDIVEYFSNVSNSQFVKLCLSSRPWPLFKETFRDSPQLKLQDLTFEDIKHYVEDKLHSNPRMLALEAREPNGVAQLVQSLVGKASGVFLWVTLVTRSILKGLGNRDNITTLARRLDALPPDLECIYGYMLSSIDPIYKEEGSKIFQLFRKSQNMEDIYWALTADLETTLKKPLPTPDQYCPGRDNDGFKDIYEEMEMLLQTRCGGLIEILSITKETKGQFKWKEGYLAYIHATVADFLDQPEVWSDITRHTMQRTGTWDPYMALLMSSVLRLKSPKCFDVQEQRETLPYIWQQWAFTENVIFRMMESMSFNVDTATVLLDEFEVAATNLAQLFQVPRGCSWGPINHHWSQRSKPGILQADFLSLAVERGLIFYVNRKLKFDQSLIFAKATPPRRPPLLAFVILGQSVIDSIAEVLLECSADPNELFEGFSLWRYLIHIIHTSAKKGRFLEPSAANDRRKIQAIFRAMLQSGADPNTCCIRGNGCWEALLGDRKSEFKVAGVFTPFDQESFIRHGRGVVIDSSLKGATTARETHSRLSPRYEPKDDPYARHSTNFTAGSTTNQGVHDIPGEYMQTDDYMPKYRDSPYNQMTTRRSFESDSSLKSIFYSRSFEEEHCLTQIIKDVFNTTDEPNGADELLTLVEKLKVSGSLF